MKKKAIERIPFLTPNKVDKQYSHVAVAELVEIQGEETIILDIYENKKRAFKTPLYRFAYTKKTWGQYAPQDGKWTHKKIKVDNRVLWQQKIIYKDLKKTFLAEEQIQVLEEFTNNKNWNQEEWWQCLDCLENSINWNKQKRRMELRQERLDQRNSQVEEVPQEFEAWISEELFKNTNYIYYKRKGRYATFTCSHCGQSYTYATERKENYEGQFEHVVRVPKNGEKARCEKCDCAGTYKTAGKKNNVYGIEKSCYIMQAYKQTGAIVRYFVIEKLVQIGKKESFKINEVARNYYEDGKTVITDYNLWDGWSQEEKWCDHNIGRIGAQISQKEGVIYMPSLDNLKGTTLQYSGIDQYVNQYETIRVARYMSSYMNYRCIEMFTKMGMYDLVNDLVEYWYDTYIKDKSANTPHELLGIYKEKLKFLVKEKGNIKLLKILQLEKNMHEKWNEKQCLALRTISPRFDNLKIALEFMTLQQFLNRVEKYAGVEIGAGCCGRAIQQLQHTTNTYLDYLRMRSDAGYDLNNSIYAYPRSIEEEHDKIVQERHRAAIEKRERQVKENYPDIKANYRRLRNVYFYEDEKYSIRPARNAEEIVAEGRILHHCVGGNSYLKGHDDGRSYILFLREKNKPEKPYVTVEINARYHEIVQWYGAYDKKPDEVIISKWLNAYTTRLTCTDKATEEPVMIIAG